ncbi:hypothetical protein LBMAG42_26700 [Deltaproteobacteria bacterium]|nr:hypothetical protein LBMAG42_26700 [Deltaproteobacteria bacterium]
MTLLLLLSACAPSPDSGLIPDTADSDGIVDSDPGDTAPEDTADPCPGDDADCIDAASGDCDDANASIYPGAPETCGDAIDQDCDGYAPRCALAADLSSLDADSTLIGAPGEAAGRWVGAADLDGDGAAELLVGAPGAGSDHGFAPGVLYAARGPVAAGETPLSSSPITFTGSADLPGVGQVAAVGSGQVAMLAGKAALLYDLPIGAGAWTAADAQGIVTLDAWPDALRLSDIDLDGVDDLLVGAPEASTAELGSWAGAVYQFAGPLAGELSAANATSVLWGEYGYTGGSSYVGHFMGTDVATGDLDGDGAPDVAIGASGASLTTSSGTVYLYSGGLPAGTVAVADATHAITGESITDPLGDDLALPGDMNGDGYADLVATSRLSWYFGHGTGKVYLFTGPIDVATAAEAAAVFSGEGADDAAGEVADRAPDLNGDGALDLAVGAYGNGGAANIAGRAYVVYGPLASGAWNLADADVVISGADKGAQLGRAIDGAGDLDHDGVDDLLLGGPHTASTPAAWIFYGGR